MPVHLPRRNRRLRDFSLKLQTLALVMAVGTLVGYVLHALAATSGDRGMFAEMAFVAVTRIATLFALDGGTAIAWLSALVAIGLAISLIPVNARRDA